MESGGDPRPSEQAQSEEVCTRSKCLNIIYTNAQSVVNKIDELRSVAFDLKPDLILINESWTHKEITKAYLAIDGYELVSRRDRLDTSNGRGGGLLIYKKENLTVEEELGNSSPFNQFATVSITTDAKVPIMLTLVYRSPNSSHENNAHLDNLVKSTKKSSIIIGDMNYSGIDWENGCSTAAGSDFFTASQEAFLNQHVDFPTHEGNTIDLVLSSNDIAISSVEDVGTLGKSHHSIIHVKVDTRPATTFSTEKVPDYEKADFRKMNELVDSIDWSERLQPLDTYQSWDLFKSTLTDSMHACIPQKDRRTSDQPLWMNRNIMRLLRKKRRLWKWYKTTRDYAEYQAYLAVQKTVAKTIRSAKKKFERKIAKNFKKNPRQFYSHLNKNMKSRVQVGPLKTSTGETVADSPGMCEVLNNQFTSVFTEEDGRNIPPPIQMCHGDRLTTINVAAENVKTKIDRVKTNSAPGPDKLGPRVLKELKDVIALPLSIIFNKSLASGEVPEDWRCANVTSVYKKGSRSYRC